MPLRTRSLLALWVAGLAALGSAKDCPDFECPEPTGSFADPCTCRRFYKCSDGNASPLFCPTGLYWDDIKKFCTYKDEAVCGPISDQDRKKKTKVVEEAERVKKCDAAACQLPYCYCSREGTLGPLEGEGKKPPQLLVLMFDGAINLNNYPEYKSLFRLKAKNGCMMKGTFFVQHEYSNYYMIEELYRNSHEIAILSASSVQSLQNENETIWADELRSMRRILGEYANVPEEEILGIRAPGLRPGYNEQYEALVNEGFVWDSSISTLPLQTPVWPYTLDYAVPHVCKIKSCPTKAFPGIWELPLNSHHVAEYGGGQCPYFDQCVFTHQTSDDVFEWMKKDFMRHYEGNRAPYTMPFHTNWFTIDHQIEALHKFVNYTLTLDDVTYVSATEALLWMTDPSDVSLNEIVDSCRKEPADPPCNKPNTCELSHTEENGVKTLRYMTTCQDCPDEYPWKELV